MGRLTQAEKLALLDHLAAVVALAARQALVPLVLLRLAAVAVVPAILKL